jgi:hypothetical protein
MVGKLNALGLLFVIATLVHKKMQFKFNSNCHLPPRSMGLLGVARANTAVGVNPETFLLHLCTLCAVHSVSTGVEPGRAGALRPRP